MQHIRPYQLFALLDEPPARRVVNATIPYRRGAGSLTLLELFVALAASRIVGAKRIFEFGTFLGATTFNLALNLPADGEIFTLDLGATDARGLAQDGADAPLTRTHLSSTSCLDFLGSSISGKVKILTGNSTKFDFSRWTSTIDMAFIDGGHDLATVRSDTENSMRLVPKERLSCVLWHDYRNPAYDELTRYLDELSNQLEIAHIEDTMLCVWFNDSSGKLMPRLLKR
jgi:hypothetical protein